MIAGSDEALASLARSFAELGNRLGSLSAMDLARHLTRLRIAVLYSGMNREERERVTPQQLAELAEKLDGAADLYLAARLEGDWSKKP